MTRWIGLADCNNFYVSCERVFNPSLRGKPVLVLSNNDGSAIARSPEAKKLGIKMGQKVFKIRDLIQKEGVVLLSSNYTLYADMSERVVEAIRTFIPHIEIYSIDEVFMNLDHVDPSEMENFLTHVRSQVLRWTGIPISIGVASTKTLAKVANKMAKDSSGIYFMKDSGEFFQKQGRQIVLSDIWGIGRQSEIKLNQVGCSSVHDFMSLSPEWVKKNMTVVGLRTHKELLGMRCHDVETKFKRRKNISTSRTFGRGTHDFDEVQKAIELYTKSVVAKLKSEGLSAGYVVLFLANDPHKDNFYYSKSFSHKFLSRTNNDDQIWASVQQLLIGGFDSKIKYRKGGVYLGDLTTSGQEQIEMWRETIQSRKVNEPTSQDWQMRRDFLTPPYTTCWGSIPRIRSVLFPDI